MTAVPPTGRDDDESGIAGPTLVKIKRNKLPPEAVGAQLASWATGPKLAYARSMAKRMARPLQILDTGLLSAPLTPSNAKSALVSIDCLRVETAQGWAPGHGEASLAADGPLDADLITRAEAGIAAIVAARIGGDFGFASNFPAEPRAVLVALDLKIPQATRGALLPLAAIDRMLDVVLAAHAPETIALLMPSVPGYNRIAKRMAALGCAIDIGRADPWPWLEAAERIYCLGGDIGLLGLLLGREVTAFMASGYTGWSLTQDAHDAADYALRPRPKPRSLAEVFAGLCITGTRYIDPFRNETCRFEDTVELLASWRRLFDANQQVACCLGISFWKKARIGQFFRTPSRMPRFAKTPQQAIETAKASDGELVFWPLLSMPGFAEDARQAGVATRRIEDGFIRSVGLGTNLMPPASIVTDTRGIYFDPTGPSDLEVILAETEFDAALRARAGALMAVLVERGITKYNLAETVEAIAVPPGKRRLLVPGQVEDDKSVLLGGAGITSNAELLARVRAANPDAFIVYKGHPDVEAGHRLGLVPQAVLDALADAVLPNASIVTLIDWADEIHTLTSLSGFEALQRRKMVVTYGQPFYAGWGLTRDLGPPLPRRGRKLSIEELVAGVLILYPRYIDPVTGLFCGPEVLVERLSQPEAWKLTPLMRLRRIQGAILRRFGLSGTVGKSFK